MTRAEAKKILKRIVNTSNELTHPVLLNTEMEAIKVAIEALQLPQGVIHCKDCRWWSRKEDSPIGYCYAIRHSYYSRRWEVNIYRTYEEDFYCGDAELPPQEEEVKE